MKLNLKFIKLKFNFSNNEKLSNQKVMNNKLSSFEKLNHRLIEKSKFIINFFENIK